MPNIKSAKKRVLVNNKKTEQNKAIRSAYKTEIKKILALISENKIEEAKASLPNAFATIDSAVSKNIIHANNAANKKAKISKKLDAAIKLAGVPAPAVEEVAPAIEEAPAVEEAPVAVEEVKPAKKPATKKTTTATKTTAKKPAAKKATKKDAE